MASGPISSPALWLNGTVLEPAWAQRVQDNINGWMNGTGATMKMLQIDGVGGNPTTAPAGTVSLTAIGAGQTLPTPASTRGMFYRESGLFAAAVFDGTGAITFSSGLNIQSVTRSSAGVYVVNLVTASTSTMCINVSLNSLSNLTANFEVLSQSSIRITCKTSAGTATDCAPHVTVFQL